MKLSKITCEEFAQKLASKEPVPGGGGVAALVGSLGAALGSMVGNYSIGKKKFLGMEAKHQEIIDKSCDLMNKLLELIDEDAETLNHFQKHTECLRIHLNRQRKRRKFSRAVLKLPQADL